MSISAKSGKMEQGTIFDIKRYAIHDGPGIRTTVFFKGCPLNCPWCHNPEGMKTESEIMVSETKCIGCGECVSVCEPAALSISHGSISLDRGKCNLCMECIRTCHSQTLELAGRQVTAEEILEEIEKDILFYDESGGGVTFSGGEPLLQPKLLGALLTECKKQGINTALDTSGYDTSNALVELSDNIDLFLFDLKLMDPEKHMQFTGVSNEPILKNLWMLSKGGKPISIRIPIIPGVTDDPGNIVEIGKFLASLTGIQHTHLLPYHEAWIHKREKLGQKVRASNWSAPPEAGMLRIREKLEGFGLKVEIGNA